MINEIPVEFDQTLPSLTLYNPGYLQKDNGATIQLGYKGFNSLSNNLRTFFSNINWVPNSQKGHSIGLDAFSDQEGKFIQHTRLYGKYAYFFSLNKSLKACLGLGLGVVNFQVKSNAATAGFSDSQIDAKIGGHIYSSKFSFSASILQFLDQKLVLEKSEIVLRRYYQGHTSYEFYLNTFLTLTEAAYVRYAPNYPLDFRIINKLSFYKKAYLSLTAQIKRGTIIELGLENFDWKDWKLGIGLSYRVITDRTYQVNTNAVELTLAIQKPNNDKGVTKDENLY